MLLANTADAEFGTLDHHNLLVLETLAEIRCKLDVALSSLSGWCSKTALERALVAIARDSMVFFFHGYRSHGKFLQTFNGTIHLP